MDQFKRMQELAGISSLNEVERSCDFWLFKFKNGAWYIKYDASGADKEKMVKIFNKFVEKNKLTQASRPVVAAFQTGIASVERVGSIPVSGANVASLANPKKSELINKYSQTHGADKNVNVHGVN